MKTLDDALKTPGVIEGGAYDTGWAIPWGLLSSVYGCERGGVTLRGRFMPRHLRLIADHLDPQPDSSPVIPEGYALIPTAATLPDLDPGCGVAEFISSEARCCGGMAWDLYAGILNRVAEHVAQPPLRTEAEVRAEALKDWPKFCEILGVDPSLSMGQVAAHVHGKVANIRAEARREALEEAAKVCDALQRKHDAAFDGVVDRARAGVTDLELAGAAAAGMETSARIAAAAIRALIEKERA